MGQTQIKVPEGMLKASLGAAVNNRRTVHCDLCSLNDLSAVLEAALRWLSNEIGRLRETTCVEGVDKEFIAGMEKVRNLFAVPEIPEDIRELCRESFRGLRQMTIGEALDVWPKRIEEVAIEAFNRGRTCK